MAVRVYNSTFYGDMAVGSGDAWQFDMNFPNREAKIKTITWNLRSWITGTIANRALENINVLEYVLQLGSLVNLIGEDFTVVAAPVGGVFTGNRIMQFYKPGQYKFDSFYLRNFMNCALYMNNLDGANSWTYQTNIIVETEEKIKYQ